MPPSDFCEPEIIRAIEKAGFLLTHRQFAIRPTPNENFVYIDLRFKQEKGDRIIIIVEVKCFPSSSTFTEEFYQAVGQYLVYRNSLNLAGIEGDLYLAFPVSVYEDYIMQRLSTQAALRDAGVKTIIVDLSLEEVVEWKTW